MKKMFKKVKTAFSQIENTQAGWTTMEYVVGAIALVTVVTMVLNVFRDKLIAAINSLTI